MSTVSHCINLDGHQPHLMPSYLKHHINVLIHLRVYERCSLSATFFFASSTGETRAHVRSSSNCDRIQFTVRNPGGSASPTVAR
jgi:hypothetical protein